MLKIIFAILLIIEQNRFEIYRHFYINVNEYIEIFI